MKKQPVSVSVPFVVLLSLAAFGVVHAGPKDDSATVGWFLNEVAVSRHITVAPGSDPAAALRASGINVPQLDNAKILTEADVVEVSRALGVSVTTRNPEAAFNRSKAQAFLSSIVLGPGGEGSAQTRDIGGVPNDASDNGKGKKKGHNKSSSEPL